MAEPSRNGPRRPRPPLDLELLRREIEALLERREGDPDAALVVDMIENALKCARDGMGRGDLKVLSTVLRELRYAARVFAPYRRVRKVSIFGSARTPVEAPEYRQAFAFAGSMTRHGWMVITGAGGGIMEAAQGGAGRERSFGVNIRLPFEQKANTVIAQDHKLVNFKYFFTRKLTFVKETDAIALFPGGYGTHDEGFESLTLVQTGKSSLLPIVFIDAPGGTYWKEWRRYLESHLCDRGYVDPSDLGLFLVTDDIDEAVAEIQGFYRNYHSMRYVSSRLVLRLRHPVSDGLLDRLNRDFAGILSEGKIERTGVLQDEENEPETHDLHRLAFWFDRRNTGKLREMVNVLNRSVEEGKSSADTPVRPGADQVSTAR